MNVSPLVAGLIASTPALAEEQRANLTAAFSVAGEFQILILSDEERPCADVVFNTEYNHGRLGFYFIDDSELGGLVSFSGIGPEQRSPAEDLRMQPSDAVNLKDSKMSIRNTEALGVAAAEKKIAWVDLITDHELIL